MRGRLDFPRANSYDLGMGPRKLPRFLRRTARGGRASGRIGYSAATREETSGIPETYQPSDREGKTAQPV